MGVLCIGVLCIEVQRKKGYALKCYASEFFINSVLSAKRLFINKKICLFINSQIELVVVLMLISYFCERRSKNKLNTIKKINIEREKTPISIFSSKVRFTMF